MSCHVTWFTGLPLFHTWKLETAAVGSLWERDGATTMTFTGEFSFGFEMT